MAKGRMINRTITRSRKFQKCGDDFTRLLYCMILPFLDRDGKMEADPLLLKADLFPLRTDLSEKDIQEHLLKLAGANLIDLYTVEEEQYLHLGGFRENQEGMRYDKERASQIPESPNIEEVLCGDISEQGQTKDIDDTEHEQTKDVVSTEQVRTKDGAGTEKVRVNRNRNKKEKKNYNTPLTPHGGTGVSDSGFVDDSIKHWNSLPNLPPCRYLSVNLPEVGEVRSRIAVVGPEAAGKAMENLAKFWEFIEARYRPVSFHRFITRSLDNWLDDARPWERYEVPEKKETVSACAPAEDNFKPLSNEEWEEAGEGLQDLKQAVRRA